MKIAKKFHHGLIDALSKWALEAWVFCIQHPTCHNPIKLFVRHAGMSNCEQLGSTSFSACRKCLFIVIQHCSEGLFLLPIRMIRYHLLNAGFGEDGLGIDGLFYPKRSIIIKGGDALGRRHEIG